MKNFLKKTYNFIIGKRIANLHYRMFLKSQGRFIAENELRRMNHVHSNATVSIGASISQNATISNNLNDRSKISIGKYSVINGHLLLFKQGGEINIGEYCFVGKDSKIWSAKNIRIGNRVLIANNVNIHDNNSHSLNPELRHNDFLNSCHNANKQGSDLNEKDIIIEDDVWIGFNATIMKGVTLGKGSVIGACSVVLKDVKPNTLVVGNPAMEVKRI
ncbi:MAG TPA: acyltransferase [Bacteroidia bacterium]